MKAFHVICGLPRSGSTLLCNILAQNPAFHVLHTSPLPSIINYFAQGVTDTPEIKGMLQRDEAGTDEKTCEMARGMVRALHTGKEVCFDKNRLWNEHQFTLAQLFPDAKIICCVRDLRAVFGSFEKRWRRNPLMQMPPGRTVRARMQNQFSAEGMIGGALGGVEDLKIVGNRAVLFVWYEQLAQDPRMQVRRIYDHINEEPYEHDFDNVENTAADPDWLYLNKFPHNGSGKVEYREDWQQFVPPQIAGEIMQTHAAYNQIFGYV